MTVDEILAGRNGRALLNAQWQTDHEHVSSAIERASLTPCMNATPLAQSDLFASTPLEWSWVEGYWRTDT